MTHEEDRFDQSLAIECANAYSLSSGLGCTVSDKDGAVLYEAGYGLASCKACGAANLARDGCMRAAAYGLTAAERFGGRYIYFCPMGLTCFVSPILGRSGAEARITAGPFLMVDADDYWAFDLKERLGLDDETAGAVAEEAARLPTIPPGRVNALSALLFMAAGFLGSVAEANRMLDVTASGEIQGRITEYIMTLKAEKETPEYPVRTEKALLASIASSDKAEAGRLLNELLGHILFSSGGNFAEIKSRVMELLALISRAAVDAGASAEETFRMNHIFYQKAASTADIDELCFLLTDLMNKYIDSLFTWRDARNMDVLSKAIHYLRRNCAKKLTLEDVARETLLSPTYFSKLFKQETGVGFNAYLNRLRVEKSKQLLLQSDLKMVAISNLSGFEDQSYFTKVFRRVTGMSPGEFRKTGGRG